jgi:ABC-type bacteriocin/lantibiotic exporter with double-glycine peptidase domain
MKDFITSTIITILETIIFVAIILGIMHLVAWIVSWGEQHPVLFLIITIPCLAKAMQNEINRI